MSPLFLPGKDKTTGKAVEDIPEDTVSSRKESPANTSTSSTSFTTSSESLLQRLGDVAFDFGVVAVYSCPNSCVKEHQNSIANNKKSDNINDMKSDIDGNSNIFTSSDFTNKNHRTTTTSLPPTSTSSSSFSSNSAVVNFECIIVQGPSDF